MKIGVFIKSTTFHKGHGGLETQNKILCEGLAKRGHEVTVFSPAKELNFTEKLEGSVKYIFIPCVYRMLLSSVDKNNWLNKSYKKFEELHKHNSFNIVISQSSAGLGIIKRKNELGIRVLGISHGTIGGEMKTLLNSTNGLKSAVKLSRSLIFGTVNYFGRQRKYIHGCNKVVAVSSAVKDAIINETFSPSEKIVIIHNGIDPLKIPQKDWGDLESNKQFKVLYIGRIEESKGLKELLEACKDNLDIHVDIVGDGPFLEELKRLSREYKMSQRIVFFGRLPYDKTVEMYSCCSLFILPTKRVEGLPMTLVEASFAGLPIITTDVGGNKDAVENNVNGYLLKNANVGTLREKINELSKDRNKTKGMGLNGRILAENKFTLDKMLDKYEELL